MIYYTDQAIVIRNMVDSDAAIITREELAQGWHAAEGKYILRLKDQREGRAISLVAEYLGQAAGYINIYPNATWGAFAGKGYPEIVDFGVLEKYRCKGIGSKLMDVAEKVAREYSTTVSLGVGMNTSYGSAQRMYVKRGYIPDGTGVWYQGIMWPPYTNCCNDDELILYFSKQLDTQPE